MKSSFVRQGLTTKWLLGSIGGSIDFDVVEIIKVIETIIALVAAIIKFIDIAMAIKCIVFEHIAPSTAAIEFTTLANNLRSHHYYCPLYS